MDEVTKRDSEASCMSNDARSQFTDTKTTDRTDTNNIVKRLNGTKSNLPNTSHGTQSNQAQFITHKTQNLNLLQRVRSAFALPEQIAYKTFRLAKPSYKLDNESTFIPLIITAYNESPWVKAKSYWGGSYYPFTAQEIGITPAQISFCADNDNLSEIQVMFGTFSRTNTCQIEIKLFEIKDTQTTLIRSERFSANTLNDNSYHRFIFAPIASSKGKWFQLLIRADSVGIRNSVVLWGRAVAPKYLKLSGFLTAPNSTIAIVPEVNKREVELKAITEQPNNDKSLAFTPIYTAYCSRHALQLHKFGWNNSSSERILAPLVSGTEVAFDFHSRNRNLSKIEVQIDTYNRINSCSVELSLYEINDNAHIPVTTRSVSIVTLDDSSRISFEFETIANSANKRYHVVLTSSDATFSNCIGIWGTLQLQVEKSIEGHDFYRSICDLCDISATHRPTVFIPRYSGKCAVSEATQLKFGWQGESLPINAIELLPDRTISIPFISPANDLEEIQLVFGTFARRNTCHLEFLLYEGDFQSRVLLRYEKISANILQDNQSYSFKFNKIADSANRTYTLVIISPDASNCNNIAIWGNDLPIDSSKHLALECSTRLNIADHSPTLTLRDNLEERHFAFPARLAPGWMVKPRIMVIMGAQGGLDGINEIPAARHYFDQLDANYSLITSSEIEKHTIDLLSFDLILLVDVAITDDIRKFLGFAKRLHVMIFAVMGDGFANFYTNQNSAVSKLPRSEQRAWREGTIKMERAFKTADGILARSATAAECAARFGKTLIRLPDLSSSINKDEVQETLNSAIVEYRRKHLPSFTIVSILYNKAKEVEYFLEALLRQSYEGQYEIILVNDCTADNSVEVVENYVARAKLRRAGQFMPQVKIIHNDRNLGNCGSRNAALKLASGDLVVIIDADCMVNRDFLREHAAAHAVGDCQVVIGPFNLETNGQPPLAVLSEFESSAAKVSKESQLQDLINRYSFLNCITRNFSIRKTFIKGELFDELFSYSKDPKSGFGWEDVEMGYRLYKEGVRIKFATRAFSIHVSHPPSVDEKTKPLRSLLNFKRLLDKHQDIEFVARRWVLDTYRKICSWADGYSLPHNSDRLELDSRFARYPKSYFYGVKPRNLRIATYRWHCPHQYELYKLPYQFSLLKDTGVPFTNVWSYDERPMRENAKFISRNEFKSSDYDMAILHFDENVLAPENTNGVLETAWGSSFQWLKENAKVPVVAICHGTPQFYGQYKPQYKEKDLGTVIETERKRLVDFLGDTLVILNSYQAQAEWGFKNSRVVWQGFDPSEFPESTYKRGILTLGRSMEDRPYYRGYWLYSQVMQGFPAEFAPSGLAVEDPDAYYPKHENVYAQVKYRNYVDVMRNYSIYFNPTLRSPMPRARGEAMMCGLVTVSANNHDVELFIKNGWNGFYSNDPGELREYLLYLCRNPERTREIGARARLTAMDVFNHDRYLLDWEDIISRLV